MTARPLFSTAALASCSFLALAALPAQEEPAETQDAQAADDGIDVARLRELTDDIRDDVELLRELDFERPVDVAIADKEGFLGYVRERIERSTPKETFTSIEEAVELLGLVPADMNMQEVLEELLQGQVGGFYDPGADKFYLMEGFGGGVARIILAHELVHALDDQHFDLDGQLEAAKGNADREFAFSAVVEGSATQVMTLWSMENIGLEDIADLQQIQEQSQDSMADAPAYLWKPLLGAYMRGAAFLGRSGDVMAGLTGSGSMEDFDRAFRDPPTSSEQILHPEKYWDAELRDDPIPVELSLSAEAQAAGWSALHTDTLGELGLALFCEDPAKRDEPMGNPQALDYTNDAAAGWGGDRWTLLGRGDARALVLVSAWDDENEAREFTAKIEGMRGELAKASAACAKVRGLADSAFLVRPGASPGWVVVASAAGIGPEELVGLTDAVQVQSSAR